MTSKHYTEDRQSREAIINLIGAGKPVARFIVDRGHRNGAEVHEITDTAIINIYNQKSGKMVTKLIARPGQLRRYNWEVPQSILAQAIDHSRKGYNER